MDMKCYDFKDGRRIFKWVYLVLLLSILNVAISFISNRLSATPMTVRTLAFQVIVYLVIIIIFFRKTRTQIFVNDTNLKAKRVIHFMSITGIKVTHDIEIITDSSVGIIKLIDLENNYDKYKELLEQILGNVNRNIALVAGSADKLLESAIANTKQRYSVHKLADGKVELGGWLTYFKVIAYFAVIGGGISIITVAAVLLFGIRDVGAQQIVMFIQFGVLFLCGLMTIILMNMRKNSVKYALAAQPLASIILVAYYSINKVIDGTGFAYILLVIVGFIISAVLSILMAKIYIEYIDTFERPKQTLTN